MTPTALQTSTPVDEAHQAIFDAGLMVREEVLGDEHVHAAPAQIAGSDGSPDDLTTPMPATQPWGRIHRG